jgi:hypothetical protein
MGLSVSYCTALVYHHQNYIVFLVLEVIQSGPGFSSCLRTSHPFPNALYTLMPFSLKSLGLVLAGPPLPVRLG